MIGFWSPVAIIQSILGQKQAIQKVRDLKRSEVGNYTQKEKKTY